MNIAYVTVRDISYVLEDWKISDIPELSIGQVVNLGGSGSGHRGHAGRPGQEGGSLPRGATGFIPKVYADTRAAFEKYKKKHNVDPDLTVEEFASRAWVFHDEQTGLHTTLKSITLIHDAKTKKDLYISFVAEIDDARGNLVGSIERNLYIVPGIVENDLFGLNLTGTGFGSRFYAHSEEHLMQMGVRKIQLEADLEVGAYSWAKLGFDWASAWEGNRVNESFHKYWHKKYGSPYPTQSKGLKPWEMAALVGPDGARIGKQFLLDDDLDIAWEGVKVLDPSSRGFKVGEIYYKSKGIR